MVRERGGRPFGRSGRARQVDADPDGDPKTGLNLA